jgi:hypothetical protein
VEVIDPTGAKLASVGAGETKLFAMATPAAGDPAAAPAPAAAAPSAPAPHTVVGGMPLWVWLTGAATVGTTVGFAISMNRDDNSAVVVSPSH